MEQWVRGFIMRYGTHITMSSVHGSRAQALSSINSRTESASQCNDLSLCGTFKWAEALDISACLNTSGCQNNSNMQSSSTLNCAALGGAVHLQSQVCDPTRNNATDFGTMFTEWENGGDLDSDSSAIGYSFVSISDYLLNMD